MCSLFPFHFFSLRSTVATEYSESPMLEKFSVEINMGDIRIKGAGIGKTVYYGSFWTQPSRTGYKDFKGIVISDMTITNPFGSAVLVRESGMMKLENCEITGCNQGALVEGFNHEEDDYHFNFRSTSTNGRHRRTYLQNIQASLELSNCHIHHNRHTGASVNWAYLRNQPKQTYLKLTDCEIDHNGSHGVYCEEAVVDIYGDKTDIHHNRKKGCMAEIHHERCRDLGYPSRDFKGISIHLPMSPIHHNCVPVHLDNPMAAEMESDNEDEAKDIAPEALTTTQWYHGKRSKPKAVKSKPPAGNWSTQGMRYSDKDDYQSDPSDDDDEKEEEHKNYEGPCGTYCHADEEKRALCGCGQPPWVKTSGWKVYWRNQHLHDATGPNGTDYSGWEHTLQAAYQKRFEKKHEELKLAKKSAEELTDLQSYEHMVYQEKKIRSTDGSSDY